MLSLKTPHCVCFLLDVIVFSLFLGHFLLGAAVQSAHLVYMSSVSVVRASLIFSEPKLKVRRYPFNCASKLARYGFCCSFICWKWKELPRFRFHLRFRYRHRHPIDILVVLAGYPQRPGRQSGHSPGRHHTRDQRGGRHAADAVPGPRENQLDTQEDTFPAAQVGCPRCTWPAVRLGGFQAV